MSGAMPRTLRPGFVLLVVGLMQGFTWLPIGVFVIAEEWRDVGVIIATWGMAWMLIALPTGLMAAVVAARMDEAARGGTSSTERWRLTLAGLATATAAHWAVMLTLTPVKLFWGLTSSYRSDEELLGAAVSLVVWGLVALSVWLARRQVQIAVAAGREPGSAASVPARVWVGLLYALCCGGPSMMVLVAAIDGAPLGAALMGWTLLGLAVCLLIAIVVGRTRAALAELRADWTELPSNEERRLSVAEVFGMLWCVHWGLCWLVACGYASGGFDLGARFGTQMMAVAMVCIGVAFSADGYRRRVIR
jgi:hypothetical protein